METLITENFFLELREEFRYKNIQAIGTHSKILICELLKKNDLAIFRYHPLGFIYARLYSFSNNETIRLHIWTSNHLVQKPLMNIHNHYYNVNSYVLAGTITNTLYDMVSNVTPNYGIYKGKYVAEDLRILEKTDHTAYLNKKQHDLIQKGTLYRIKKSEIHAGDSLNQQFAATIVFTEEPGNPTPLVFGPLNGEHQYKYSSNIVNAKTVNSILQILACG